MPPLAATHDEIISFHRKFRAALCDPAERQHPARFRKEHLQTVCQRCSQDDVNDMSALLTLEPLGEAGKSIVALAHEVARMEDPMVRRRYQDALGRFCDVASEQIESEELRMGAMLGGMSLSENGESATPPKISFDPATLLNQLMTQDTLPSLEIITELVLAGRDIFRTEENLLTVPVPCVVVGDIHGQLRDLQRHVLQLGGPLGVKPYLFLGDFVDRGASSLHCMAILICAKILHPKKVFLIRGNHESRLTNSVYGFLSECHSKYPVEITEDTPPATYNLFFSQPTHPLWANMNSLFDSLPLAAIVGDRVFCVHGGLSPRAGSIDTIIGLHRFSDIDHGVMSDLTWSDPFFATGFQYNHRGCGQLFGEDITTEFVRRNNLLFVCRAHQCVKDGYCWAHSEKILTLFSAPNYCGQGNLGAIMIVDEHLRHSFLTYTSFTEPASPSGDSDSCPSAETPACAPEKTVPSYF